MGIYTVIPISDRILESINILLIFLLDRYLGYSYL